MLNSFWSCFKTFFICTFHASKVTFIHFYLNGGLHAVSIRKPSERMLNFWTVRFYQIRTEFRFSAHPYDPQGNGRILSLLFVRLSVYSGRICSETAERVWLKFCTGVEVCPGPSISRFGSRRPSSPANVAENVVFVGQQCFTLADIILKTVHRR